MTLTYDAPAKHGHPGPGGGGVAHHHHVNTVTGTLAIYQHIVTSPVTRVTTSQWSRENRKNKIQKGKYLTDDI